MNNPYAYVFYATNDNYAISILILLQHLEKIGLPENCDIIVIYLDRHVSENILQKMRNHNIKLYKIEKIPLCRSEYFKYCLVKLKVFTLIAYKRVLYMDADSIPIQNMSELFHLDFNKKIAAPLCWWEKDPFHGDKITSLLLLVKPSMDLWKRIEKYFPVLQEKNIYDMDIINQEFLYHSKDLCILPPVYGCLNSEWEDKHTRFYFGDPDKSLDNIKLVHYTALGKPWIYKPEEVKELRPNAHPIFYRLWEKWWENYAQLFL